MILLFDQMNNEKTTQTSKTELYFASGKYTNYEELFTSARKFLNDHEDKFSETWGMNYANSDDS
jgi:hypothetical protein